MGNYEDRLNRAEALADQARGWCARCSADMTYGQRFIHAYEHGECLPLHDPEDVFVPLPLTEEDPRVQHEGVTL